MARNFFSLQIFILFALTLAVASSAESQSWAPCCLLAMPTLVAVLGVLLWLCLRSLRSKPKYELKLSSHAMIVKTPPATADPTFIHHPDPPPGDWGNTSPYDAYEPADFDAFWAGKLASLPPPNGGWDGGNLDIGGGKNGYGLVNWNGASSGAPKSFLIMLPSAGAPPNTGCCPGNGNFIIGSAMNNAAGSVNSAAEYIDAIMAIQQMIRNVLASGKCTGKVYSEGKSQGGGMSVITAGLCPRVLNIFASVPALSGFPGGYPYYQKSEDSGHVDAVNHTKRAHCDASFSIAYNDAVTWPRGEVTCAKSKPGGVVNVYHHYQGHDDPEWWGIGTAWLGTLSLN